ncbi:uncharacterized protein MEPE_01536 [Melanopsichium pennsylvanicum]|uniref:Uncharacterized protein n=2 Tax=Melanopsichium pennsylvanicum TaxID=63383 RepID=A0AAJ5C3P8_9BASI|nr:putative protein [Melanopsichium pennsylvanicum 4]SNX82830.1 uncharacterized protein MEPE_01536 [Melanopsichium pennsylvanicum]
MTSSSGSTTGGVTAVLAPPNSQWRSATEHDVYADNRDEDIFGWVQPDEWDTVAGISKNNFLRGNCVECVSDQDTNALPLSLHSCGGPSCGYGGQCCEYSRRATRTQDLSEFAPASLLRRSDKPAGKSKIDDLAKVEKRSSLGVSLVDIIHGRSCRPISLLDLRAFLHFQRQTSKRLPSYYPASDMQTSAIDAFDLNIDLPTTLPNSIKETQTPRRFHYDEVDALDFLVAYERYVTKFREQPRANRLKSPDPVTCKAAVRAYVRRQSKSRVSCDLTAMDVLLSDNAADDDSDIPEEVSRKVLAQLKPTDLGLRPETQPIRPEFDRLVHRYLCSQRLGVLPSNRKRGKKRDPGSPSDAARGNDTPNHFGTSKDDNVPRLRWMVDMGLISESDLQLSLAECNFSTHPDVLAPVAEAVYAYMAQHVLPFFFISVARNLSPNTKRGRLLVGVVCTLIALAFSILLIIEPSPLASRANHGTGKIVRWWRLVTAPVWGAGLGYILAYFTGLCVWLTLRGNREPDKEEEREREQIRSRISGDDVVGFDLAELQAEVDQTDINVEQETNRWMAPEIADILTGITGHKKDKHTRQISSSDIRVIRDLEEGRGRLRSEVNDAHLSTKVSFDHPLAAEKQADTTNVVGLAAPLSIEKDSALTTPAAIILHTPRRPSVMLGAGETAGRPSAAFSAVDLNAISSARPSLDRAGNSLNDLGQADAIAGSGNSPQAPALMRQKRVRLLNISIGITTTSGNERAEEHVEAPVLTRDALLFDPELAARVTSPTFATSPFDGSAIPGGGSPHDSPPLATRRKSLAQAFLPLKSSHRMQTQMQELERQSPVRDRSGEPDMEKEDLTLPKLPEVSATVPRSHVDHRQIAPWSAPSGNGFEAPSSARPLLFSLPASRRSRLSASTSTTAVAPSPSFATSGVKRAYDETPSISFRERLWTVIQRGTGFAVGTERVLDARVRRAQQMKALRIMALNTLATTVVVVIVVAIP